MRRMKSPALSSWNGINSRMRSISSQSIGSSLRPTPLTFATGLLRRVITISSPRSTRSSSSLRCALASATLTSVIAAPHDHPDGHR
jgi:hypothetical protein